MFHCLSRAASNIHRVVNYFSFIASCCCLCFSAHCQSSQCHLSNDRSVAYSNSLSCSLLSMEVQTFESTSIPLDFDLQSLSLTLEQWLSIDYASGNTFQAFNEVAAVCEATSLEALHLVYKLNEWWVLPSYWSTNL